MQNRKKVKEFKEVTGCDDKTAKQILKDYDYKVDEALDYYFANSRNYRKGQVSDRVVDEQKLNAVYDKYTDREDPDALFDEGLRNFLTDIGVDPISSIALVVFWKLNAMNVGEVSKEEFVLGWTALGCESVEQMRAQMEISQKEMQDSNEHFAQFYKWLFNYLKEEKKKRTIPLDLGLSIWSLILQQENYPLRESLSTYLKESETEVFTRDLWEQSYEFMREVDINFERYDPDGAWPYILDEFVAKSRT